ncbi:MAG: hypothetical protein ABS46_04460 [Cytophagaceae bacterium SCN 52-12]|nr:MAG: hypothetical protein ABS46_04460 [Cytophagaceae bacterium SCN 52-12]
MESIESMQRKIRQAGDLGAVVKTMKAITASNIGRYQKAVDALEAYYQTILSGIRVYLLHEQLFPSPPLSGGTTLFIVMGSDQGLVGPFNHAIAALSARSIRPVKERVEIWAVGERVEYLLKDAGLHVASVFHVPGSIQAVTTLTGRLLLEIEQLRAKAPLAAVYAIFNRPRKADDYVPVLRKLLPFDEEWQEKTRHRPWPSNRIPQIAGSPGTVFSALFREYLFTALYRSCVFSLASENASRLKAMQRAEKNIEELSGQMKTRYHQLRQDSIDTELFDIVAGFNAMRRS